MLIIMRDSKINQRSAEIIAKKYGLDTHIYRYPFDEFFTGNRNEPIVVIDLDADGHFQHTFVPEFFATRMSVRNMFDEINDIYLLVSNITLDKSLKVFATKLSNDILKKTQKKITIHIPVDFHHFGILVVPPENDEHWKVYGLNSNDLRVSNLSLDVLAQTKNKTLIWEGDDILQWLDLPEMLYAANHSWSD
ncbi:MAG: hypothetical protein ACYCQI_15105 [Gammaproteobacteria bacterium]